jgi:hypothetical protein
VIDRRILVNYRADPAVLAHVLPAPFRPKLVEGYGVVGICLIRLRDIRPRGVPAGLGLRSENAAHRIAVEWEQGEQFVEGVYIPRRDTSSQLSALMGGRLFPGVHQHARFAVAERGDSFDVALESDDRRTRVHVVGRVTATLPARSVFASLEAASEFFERGALGYSASADPQRFDGLELRSHRWQIEPLAIEQLESSFFEDRKLFPAGKIQFDSALIMRNLVHEWHAHQPLTSG